MNDVNRSLGHFGDSNRSMNAFGFGNRGPCQCMILWRGVPLFKRTFDDLINDNPILGVHANQTATRPGRGHRPKDRRIIDQKDARISHEHFEAGDAFVHHRIHLFDLSIFQLSRDQMKAIIDRALAFGFLVPVVDAL